MVTCFKFKVPTINLAAQNLSWKSLKAVSELSEGHGVDVKCNIHRHVDVTNIIFFMHSSCVHIFEWDLFILLQELLAYL